MAEQMWARNWLDGAQEKYDMKEKMLQDQINNKSSSEILQRYFEEMNIAYKDLDRANKSYLEICDSRKFRVSTAYYEALEEIKLNSNEPQCSSGETINTVMGNKAEVIQPGCHQAEGYPPFTKMSKPQKEMSSSNVPNEQAHGSLQVKIASQLEELTIKVFPQRYIINRNDPGIYKNSSSPRGLVFIANFSEFKDPELNPRLGSEKDTQNLEELFKGMGYKVPNPYKNMTSKQTKEAIKNFQNDPLIDKVDSCFVIVMSHGRGDHRRDAKKFWTWDKPMDASDDVIRRFTKKDCPKLKGIPKVFIFVVCRGRFKELLDIEEEHSIQPSTDEDFNMGETIIETGEAKISLYEDMLIIYSTVEGFVSYRDEVHGTWLVHALCDVFMKNAHDKHILDLMTMVNEKFKKYSDVTIQVCEVVNRSFRQLYLNPDPGMFLREEFKEKLQSSTDEAYNILCDLAKKTQLYAVQEDGYAKIEYDYENMPKPNICSLFRCGTGLVTELIIKGREYPVHTPISTLRLEDVLTLVEPRYPKVYLTLSYEGKELGQLQIQLDGTFYPRRVQLFADLCRTPSSSPSSPSPTWRGTIFKYVINKGLAGEQVWCSDYMNSRGYQEKLLPQDYPTLERATTRDGAPQPPGGLIQGQLKGSSQGFKIVTRRDPGDTDEHGQLLGEVVNGLDILTQAVDMYALDFSFPVCISDCGIIN